MKGTALAARRATAAVGSSVSSSPSIPSSSRFPALPQLLPQTCPLSRAPFAANSKEISRFPVSAAASAQESEGPSFFGGVDELALASSPSNIACRLVALVPSGPTPSPVAKGQASWLDVMRHEAVKIRWSDPRLELRVVEVSGEGSEEEGEEFDAAVSGADAVVAVAFGPSSPPSSGANALSLLSRPSAAAVRTLVPLGCEDRSVAGLARVDGVPVFETNGAPSSRPLLARLLPPFLSASRRAFDAFDAACSFWSRAHSDDALTALLVIADATGKVGDPPLAALDSLRGQGIGTLLCMLRNCRGEVVRCVADDGCKAALDCLTAAPPGDQVAAYRCIVSHESKLFEDFSLCVLSKNNCLGVSAAPPRFPRPRPQERWRGREMTHEIAEALFVGWRERRGVGIVEGGGAQEKSSGGESGSESRGGGNGPGVTSKTSFDGDGDDESLEPWSWRVCAGQNPAYDQFNCQYQIFYRGKGKGVLWYVPVFNVETLGGGGSGEGGGGGSGGSGKEGGGGSGRRVWRKRKYRVKRGEVPGTFWFSVLDNGVVSKEFWTIVSVSDDLGFALFSYNGAASAAGQSYSGSVLCTRGGEWPAEKHKLQLDAALKEAGVKTWELFRVNNDDCKGAPLEIDE